MNKFFIVLLGALISLFIFSACDSIPFVSQANATDTPTRRAPRPTFTPKPQPTATEQVTPTDEPTATDEAAAVTDEPTKAPVTKAPTRRPVTAAPTKPPAPTAVPPPQFQVNITKPTDKYICSQDGIFEIVVNAKRNRTPAGGIYFAVFDTSGHLLQNGAGQNLVAVTESEISISIGSNCLQEADFVNPNSVNGKLDVSDTVRQGNTNLIFRFVKSATDMTGISPDFPVTFGKGGRWFFYVQVK